MAHVHLYLLFKRSAGMLNARDIADCCPVLLAASCLALRAQSCRGRSQKDKRSHVPAASPEEALGTALPQAQPAALRQGGVSALSFCVCRLPGWLAQL